MSIVAKKPYVRPVVTNLSAQQTAQNKGVRRSERRNTQTNVIPS